MCAFAAVLADAKVNFAASNLPLQLHKKKKKRPKGSFAVTKSTLQIPVLTDSELATGSKTSVCVHRLV